MPLAADAGRDDRILSEEIAVILAVIYILSLVFSFETHRQIFEPAKRRTPPAGGSRGMPEWSRGKSLIVLVVATVGVAVMSEMLVGSVDRRPRPWA